MDCLYCYAQNCDFTTLFCYLMRMARSFRTIPLTHVYHRNLRRFINTVPSAPFLKENAHRGKKVFRGVPRACSLFCKKFWNNNGNLIHLEEIDNKIYIAIWLPQQTVRASLCTKHALRLFQLKDGEGGMLAFHTWKSLSVVFFIDVNTHHLLGKESSNSTTVYQNMQADHCKLG